jgi:hypothetical protein
MKWRSTLVVTTVGVALALVGCSTVATKAPGPNGPSVASLLASMKAGFAHASSVHVSGTGAFGSKVTGLDFGIFRSGDMSGSVTEGTFNANVIDSGGRFYVYVNKAFVKYLGTTEHIPASACKLICGKYISVPASALGHYSFGSLFKQIETGIPAATSVPHIQVTTYQGQPAYELSDNQGREIFVAKNGIHYLLGAVDPGKFRLSFSEWNAVPPVTAPPASKIVKT